MTKLWMMFPADGQENGEKSESSQTLNYEKDVKIQRDKLPPSNLAPNQEVISDSEDEDEEDTSPQKCRPRCMLCHDFKVKEEELKIPRHKRKPHTFCLNLLFISFLTFI